MFHDKDMLAYVHELKESESFAADNAHAERRSSNEQNEYLGEVARAHGDKKAS